MWVDSSLRRVSHLLADQCGLLGDDVARLENGSAVPEYEIHGSVDGAVGVELAKSVSVECVLEAVEGAAVECHLIRTHSHCHSLVATRSSCVPDGEILPDESTASHN